MTYNSPTARLVSHCSTTRTAGTSRTGGLMTFTTRIKSCTLENPPNSFTAFLEMKDLFKDINLISNEIKFR